MRKLLLSLLLSSCQPNAPVQTSVKRAAIKFNVDGVYFEGMGHVSRKSSLKIGLNLPKNTQYGLLSTCARDVLYENPPQYLEFRYIPTKAESSRFSRSQSCLLEFLAIDAKGNEHWAVLDFGDSSTLEAEVDCGAQPTRKEKGFSTCQGRTGKFLIISFQTQVRPYVSTLPGCPQPREGHVFSFDRAKVWEVPFGSGMCVYGFMESQGARHRLTTRGWDDVAIYR